MNAYAAAIPPKVLVVCSIVPFPETRGDPVRIMSILRALKMFTDLHVWCVNTTGNELSQLREELGYPDMDLNRVIEFQPDRQNFLSKVGPIGRYGFALVTGVPVWIRQRASRALKRSISQVSPADFAAVLFLGEAAGK